MGLLLVPRQRTDWGLKRLGRVLSTGTMRLVYQRREQLLSPPLENREAEMVGLFIKIVGLFIKIVEMKPPPSRSPGPVPISVSVILSLNYWNTSPSPSPPLREPSEL